MRKEELQVWARKRWLLASELWRRGCSARELAGIMGYSDVRSMNARIYQIRRVHPDLFPRRKDSLRGKNESRV